MKAGESACAQMKIATSLVAQFGGQLKDGRFTLNLLTTLASDLGSIESDTVASRPGMGCAN